jgi:choline dehydrogenase-like flavoprotein
MADGDAAQWDYVIVGSGAGGATLAARMAEEGRRVFVLEAGGDALGASAARLPDDYQVPAFHPFGCENPAMRWDFQVRHYTDETRQARDPKYSAARGGVLYPRAGTLGGCTAHNAMIYMLPHDSDWEHIAQLTGDDSWRPANMHRYVQRLEACHYRPLWRFLRWLGIDPSGHGWDGWLRTECPEELHALGDEELKRTVKASVLGFAKSQSMRQLLRWQRSIGDPNVKPSKSRSFEGLCYTPLANERHARTGGRERLLRVAARYPDRLHIELDALATRVIFDDTGAAAGVEYLKGSRLYRADPAPQSGAGELSRVMARREVVLCGGAFNTPQLLMLSGVGAAAQLRAHGIAVRADLPGVGRNLQDRYEVAITHRMRQDWKVLEGALFERGDRLWNRWSRHRDDLYASNGAAIAFVRKTARELPEPDIFCMALPARFEGYFPDFSKSLQRYHNYLTWAVLKAHTLNRAGSVTLRSADARDVPQVNFHYFDEADDPHHRDLHAIVDAIEFVRELTRPLIEQQVIAEECAPGPSVRSPEDLSAYIRDTAWGHHASCSCPIGAPEDGGVLNSAFAVHGVRGLRVVDASAFPRIPGFFLVSAVYLIAEKAADAILSYP